MNPDHNSDPASDWALDDDDSDLLERLGAVAAVVDPVPAYLRDASRALLALREPSLQLMDVVDEDRLEPVRGGRASRMHFFQLRGVTLDAEITGSDGFCSVLGVVADPEVDPDSGPEPGPEPDAVSSLSLETTSATFTSPVGPDGRFEVPRAPAALMRLKLTRPDGSGLTTPWFDPL